MRYTPCKETYPGRMRDPVSGGEYDILRVCGLPTGHTGTHLSRLDPRWPARMRDWRAS